MKTNKRILFILILVTLCFTMISCKKVNVFDETKANDYIDAYYEYLSDQKQGFVAIDLRTLESEYAEGHLKGFISYQYYKTKKENETDAVYESRMSESFNKWMTLNYSKSLTVFLLDNDGKVANREALKLKNQGYKKIYIYTGDFNTLQEQANGVIEIVKGIDDCGC